MKLNKLVSLGFFCPALAGFLFGYHTGVISGALLFIRKYFHLSTAQQESLTSGILLSSFVALVLSSMLINYFGIKKIMIAAYTLIMLGALGDYFHVTIHELSFTRYVIGFGLGLNMIAMSLYVTDVAPKRYQNSLLAIYSWGLTVGDLAAQLFDFYFSRDHNWHLMLSIGGIPAIIGIFGLIIFLPESPHWLLEKHKTKKAKDAIASLGLTSPESKDAMRHEEEVSSWHDLFMQHVKFVTLFGVILAAIEQATGVDSLVFYAPLILEKAGLKSAHIAIGLSLLVSVVGVIMSLITVFIIDNIGPFKLLKYGLKFIIRCLTALALSFIFFSHASILPWIVLVALILFNASFDMTVGSVIWVLVPQVFPRAIRTKGISLSLMVNWLIYFVVTRVFLTSFNLLTVGGTFLLFAILSALSLWFVMKNANKFYLLRKL